jgi:hypothetical protein
VRRCEDDLIVGARRSRTVPPSPAVGHRVADGPAFVGSVGPNDAAIAFYGDVFRADRNGRCPMLSCAAEERRILDAAGRSSARRPASAQEHRPRASAPNLAQLGRYFGDELSAARSKRAKCHRPDTAVGRLTSAVSSHEVLADDSTPVDLVTIGSPWTARCRRSRPPSAPPGRRNLARFGAHVTIPPGDPVADGIPSPRCSTASRRSESTTAIAHDPEPYLWRCGDGRCGPVRSRAVDYVEPVVLQAPRAAERPLHSTPPRSDGCRRSSHRARTRGPRSPAGGHALDLIDLPPRLPHPQ